MSSIPRRGSDAATGVSHELADVETAIAALENREIRELRTEWRKLYRTEPPRRLSRDLILRAIAYRLQERMHGGLGLATTRRLDALAEELKTKGASHFDADAVLKPGTKLIREWHWRTHTVMVTEGGFEYSGQRYRSLTRIAGLITGVHWSGPVFFGLRKRSRAQPGAGA
jgi:hypothetical protein